MFLQLVRDVANPQNAPANVQALFQYHPLQITALIETAWRNGQAGNAFFPFDAWPQGITDPIINAFPAQPGLQNGAANWDHLIYAYFIENTRIHDIFQAVIDAFQHGERLQVPSAATQRFLRNTEYLLYSDPAPTTVWNLTSRTRRDEHSHRMTNYWRAFGLDLAHAAEISDSHPYEKPEASNVEFVPTFETLLGEVWRGITNARNFAGENETDNEAVRRSARQIFDMLATRRLHGTFAREEFRAVSVMSWLHLAVMFNSPVVLDLRAEAASPELRLAKIGARVGIEPHPQSWSLFQLAQPASFLMFAIEQGLFNNPLGAQALYLIPRIQRLMEVVIDQYGTAMDRNVKAKRVALVPQVQTQRRAAPAMMPRMAAPASPMLMPRSSMPVQLAAPRMANGAAARPALYPS
jgi:hypothetical protein